MAGLWSGCQLGLLGQLGRLARGQAVCLVGWLVVRLAGGRAVCLVGWLVVGLSAWMAGWCLDGWLAGREAVRWVGWRLVVELSAWMVGWC